MACALHSLLVEAPRRHGPVLGIIDLVWFRFAQSHSFFLPKLSNIWHLLLEKIFPHVVFVFKAQTGLRIQHCKRCFVIRRVES